MKKIFLYFFFIYSIISQVIKAIGHKSEFLKSVVEYGLYKPDNIYTWSQNNENPILFGFFYSTLQGIPLSITEKISKCENKNLELFRNCLNDLQIILNNHENSRFSCKKQGIASGFLLNDGIGVAEKLIKDEELGIVFSIKSIRKFNEISVFLNIQRNETSKEYISLFFFVYLNNRFINYSFDKENFLVINNKIKLRHSSNDNFFGFWNHSLKIQKEEINEIDEVLLNLLDNKVLLPEKNREKHQEDENLLFLQTLISANTDHEFALFYSDSLETLTHSKNWLNQNFEKEFVNNQKQFNDIIKRRFINNKPIIINENYSLISEKVPLIFSDFLSSINHYAGQMPFSFSLKESRLFENIKEYSVLSFEPYSLFSHGIGLFLTCKYDLILCASLLKNLFGQVNFMGWLPINLNPWDAHNFNKEKETLTAPPTFLMSLQYIVKLVFDKNTHIEEKTREILTNFLKNEAYPKLQLILKYYLHSFRKIPKRNEPLNTPYFQWNLGDIGDYPRAIKEENMIEHVDLICWISDINLSLIFLSRNLEYFNDFEEYDNLFKNFILKDFPYKFIDSKRVNEPIVLRDIISTHYLHNGMIERVYSNTISFSNISPLTKGLLAETEEFLNETLDLLIDEKLLGSKYGVKALNKIDKNTRNYISLECNFLILRGLKLFYANHQRSNQVYNQIRNLLLSNILQQFKLTGQFFDKYCVENGEPIAIRGEPSKMAGAIVILIINEDY